MKREYLENIKSENRIDRIRLIMPTDPVIGGQPNDNEDEFTSNTPLLDLACTMKFAVDEVEKNKKGVETDLTEIKEALDTKASTEYVDQKFDSIEIPEVNLTGYATEKYVDEKISNIPKVDTSNLVEKKQIANELGSSKDKVASQFLLNEIYKAIIESIEVPVDQVFVFEGSVPPKGQIARNGQKIDRNTMPKLYERYGERMPDDRDRVLRMAGELAGTAGETQEDAMQDHMHNQGTESRNRVGSTVDSGTWSGAFQNRKSNDATYGVISSNARVASETRVKSRIVIFCNKIQ